MNVPNKWPFLYYDKLVKSNVKKYYDIDKDIIITHEEALMIAKKEGKRLNDKYLIIGEKPIINKIFKQIHETKTFDVRSSIELDLIKSITVLAIYLNERKNQEKILIDEKTIQIIKNIYLIKTYETLTNTITAKDFIKMGKLFDKSMTINDNIINIINHWKIISITDHSNTFKLKCYKNMPNKELLILYKYFEEIFELFNFIFTKLETSIRSLKAAIYILLPYWKIKELYDEEKNIKQSLKSLINRFDPVDFSFHQNVLILDDLASTYFSKWISSIKSDSSQLLIRSSLFLYGLKAIDINLNTF